MEVTETASLLEIGLNALVIVNRAELNQHGDEESLRAPDRLRRDI
jgi:hypothetical protein